MTFKQFTSLFITDDSVIGDVAQAIDFDDTFPKVIEADKQNKGNIYHYLMCSGADDDQLLAFLQLWYMFCVYKEKDWSMSPYNEGGVK